MRERSGKFSNSAGKSEQHVLVSKRNINFIRRGGSLKAWLVSPHLPTPTQCFSCLLFTRPFAKAGVRISSALLPLRLPPSPVSYFVKNSPTCPSLSGHWLYLRFGHRPFTRVMVSLPTDFSDSLSVALHQSVLHPLRPVTILKQERNSTLLLKTCQWLLHTLGNDGF